MRSSPSPQYTSNSYKHNSIQLQYSLIFSYSMLTVLHAKEVVFLFKFGNCPKKMTLGRGEALTWLRISATCFPSEKLKTFILDYPSALYLRFDSDPPPSQSLKSELLLLRPLNRFPIFSETLSKFALDQKLL